MNYYAVISPDYFAIFTSWDNAKVYTNCIKNYEHKKFKTKAAAVKFILARYRYCENNTFKISASTIKLNHLYDRSNHWLPPANAYLFKEE